MGEWSLALIVAYSKCRGGFVLNILMAWFFIATLRRSALSIEIIYATPPQAPLGATYSAAA
jgi:hypothetical protein